LMISHAGQLQLTCGHNTQYLTIGNSSTVKVPCGCKMHSRNINLPTAVFENSPVSMTIIRHSVSFPMLKLANLSHKMSDQLNQIAKKSSCLAQSS
jgi:hypothetical protein